MSDTKQKAPKTENTSMVQDTLRLFACAAGIYSIYVTYGLVHERIYKTDRGEAGARYEGFIFLVSLQSLIHALLALAARCIAKSKSAAVPSKDYAMIGFTYIGAMLCSNIALSYVAYPTQVLAKSCKLIPVMLMRIFFVGQKYSFLEYLAVAMITTGIAVFMLTKAGSKGADSTSSYEGLALLGLSLLFDGATGPKQDAIRKQYAPSVFDMMLWMNIYAVLFGGIMSVATGEFANSVNFMQTYPEIVPELLGFSCLSACGQLTILATIFSFNSLVLTTLTTTRKFFTIMASVLYFGHTILPGQWMGVAIVFGGLGLETFNKWNKKRKKD